MPEVCKSDGKDERNSRISTITYGRPVSRFPKLGQDDTDSRGFCCDVFPTACNPGTDCPDEIVVGLVRTPVLQYRHQHGLVAFEY